MASPIKGAPSVTISPRETLTFSAAQNLTDSHGAYVAKTAKLLVDIGKTSREITISIGAATEKELDEMIAKITGTVIDDFKELARALDIGGTKQSMVWNLDSGAIETQDAPAAATGATPVVVPPTVIDLKDPSSPSGVVAAAEKVAKTFESFKTKVTVSSASVASMPKIHRFPLPSQMAVKTATNETVDAVCRNLNAVDKTHLKGKDNRTDCHSSFQEYLNRTDYFKDKDGNEVIVTPCKLEYSEDWGKLTKPNTEFSVNHFFIPRLPKNLSAWNEDAYVDSIGKIIETVMKCSRERVQRAVWSPIYLDKIIEGVGYNDHQAYLFRKKVAARFFQEVAKTKDVFFTLCLNASNEKAYIKALNESALDGSQIEIRFNDPADVAQEIANLGFKVFLARYSGYVNVVQFGGSDWSDPALEPAKLTPQENLFKRSPVTATIAVLMNQGRLVWDKDDYEGYEECMDKLGVTKRFII